MPLKKISLVLSAVSFVLVVAVCISLTVDGINQSLFKNKDDFCVVIDAGHGGFDGGAVAEDGTLEKNVNLQIALKLDEACRILGFDTYMVRETDCSTEDKGETKNKKRSDLNNRLKIMKERENCIFISIHQNKYTTAQPNGTQVFYSPKISGSDLLAKSVQESVKTLVQKDNERVVKPGTSSTFLLYHAVRPAVIVECGFLSNPKDLKNLKDGNYQQSLAFAIALGVLNYCEG